MCTVSTVHRRDESINLDGTCNQKTSNRHQTRRGRGQERGQRGRSAESHSLLRVSLPHAETGQVHHHTRAPHEIHKPTGGTEIPEEGKIPSPKSGAPNPSVPYALPRARPESLESPLKFPNLLRGSPPPPSVRTTRRSRCRGFPPEGSVPATPATNCRDRPVIGDLLGPARPGAPSAEIPLSSGGGTPHLSCRPRALLLLEWRGGEDPPGCGSIRLPSAVSNPSLLGRIVK